MARMAYTVYFIMVSGLLFVRLKVQGSEATEGMKKLHHFIYNDSSSICSYIQCGGPASQDECGNGTFYMEGAAQYGCCGACVHFKQNGDVNCTGSITEGYANNNSSEFESSDRTGSPEKLYSQWCDFGLHCNSRAICEQRLDEAPCKRMQEAYDNMISTGAFVYYRDDYRWRPTCTSKGEFAEKQCKGPKIEQRCMCVDPEGNTTYGRIIPEQKKLFNDMNCMCSRAVWQRLKAGTSQVTLHCQENGNYEPLQCERGFCYCMDPITALPTGDILPESAMKYLPCFNKSLIGSQYLRRCESEYHAHMMLLETVREKGDKDGGPETVLRCDADGSYNARQLLVDQNLFYCHDKYRLLLVPVILAGDSSSGCNCARDRQTFKELGFTFPFRCAGSYGAYEAKQVIGSRAYCVDSDGVRTGPIVFAKYVNNLDCEKAYQCQAGEGGNSCKRVCMKDANTPCTPDYYVKYSGAS